MTKVLIVEDERMIAEDLKHTLIQYGYEVVGIYNQGINAIENVAQLDPNIILMDIMIEGDMNGIETGEIILKDFDIPIIFLTAYADSNTIAAAKKISPYGYILKPFEADELYASIEIALDKHSAEMKVKEAKVLFESMFTGNPEPCVYLDADFKVIDINPRFEEQFGFSLKYIKDKDINTLIIPVEYREEAAKLNKETLSGYVYYDTVRMNKFNELLPVSISAAPITINGKVKGSFVIYKDISVRKQIEEEKEKLIQKLQKALDEVKTLEGMIPICSHCKKIRDDSGFWGNVEQYISKHSNVDFSHGICPECMQRHYPEQFDKMKEKGNI